MKLFQRRKTAHSLLRVMSKLSLGNPNKDRQRFVDAVVSVSAPDWSVKLSNFENLLETPFEFGLRLFDFII